MGRRVCTSMYMPIVDYVYVTYTHMQRVECRLIKYCYVAVYSRTRMRMKLSVAVERRCCILFQFDNLKLRVFNLP